MNSRRIAISAIVLLFVLCSSVYAFMPGETFVITKSGSQYLITGEDGGPQTEYTKVLILGEDECDIQKFFNNSTGGTITIKNTKAPESIETRPDQFVNDGVTGGDTELCCNGDEGTWIFWIGAGNGMAPDAKLTVIVICPKTPSLTEYGLIVLVIMLVVSGVLVYRRRRVGATA